jgi:hypothetical protein
MSETYREENEINEAEFKLESAEEHETTPSAGDEIDWEHERNMELEADHADEL